MSRSDEPMTCAAVLDRIEVFTDGELDAATARGVQRHLAGCRSCSGQVELARSLTAELRALPKLDPPERLMLAVREELRVADAPEITGWRRRRTHRWVAAAAIVVFAVTGSVAVRHHQRQQAAIEGARAAAEIRLALACLGQISRRADRRVRHEVVDERLLPVFSRSFGLAPRTGTDGVAANDSPTRTERSSS